MKSSFPIGYFQLLIHLTVAKALDLDLSLIVVCEWMQWSVSKVRAEKLKNDLFYAKLNAEQYFFTVSSVRNTFK